jgi:hypothetical protein
VASRRGDAGTLTSTAEVLGFLLPAATSVLQRGDTVCKWVGLPARAPMLQRRGPLSDQAHDQATRRSNIRRGAATVALLGMWRTAAADLVVRGAAGSGVRRGAGLGRRVDAVTEGRGQPSVLAPRLAPERTKRTRTPLRSNLRPLLRRQSLRARLSTPRTARTPEPE